MSVCKEDLLDLLPTYQDAWVLVKRKQDVDDIITDIVNRHKQFRKFYDRIALCFDDTDTEKICNSIYTFIKENIRYKEEPKERQTTALPTGILIRGVGDCKHYASFTGGILDALNRLEGKKIDWFYRFASYKISVLSPYHVFVVVKEGDQEYWIDPVPKANTVTPVYIEDVYIKKPVMESSSNTNIGYVTEYDLMGATTDTTPAPSTDSGGGFDATSIIVSSVLTLLGGILKSINIGDNVPEYPIKSQATLQGILADMKRLFPNDPVSIADAQAQLARAQQYAAEAYAKGGAVNVTYGMIYDKIATTLKNYIATHGGGGSTTVVTNNGVPITQPPKGKDNTLLYLGLGIGGFILLSSGKKSSVSGISTTNILLLAAGGYLVYKTLKPSSDSQKNQLLAWSNNSPGDSAEDKIRFAEILNQMTPAEIADTYNFVFNYIQKSIQLPQGSALYNSIMAISGKYNIFT
jgi:hypothetical protein